MHILLVEDHHESREILGNLLRHWGVEVTGAGSHAEAIGFMESPFDAIICDIDLPDRSGYSVIAEAKRRNAAVLAIALTGFSSALDERVSKLAGFDYHLTKPFDCDEIRSVLGIGVDRKNAIDSPRWPTRAR